MKQELGFLGFVGLLGVVMAFMAFALLTPSQQTRIWNAVEKWTTDSLDSAGTGSDYSYLGGSNQDAKKEDKKGDTKKTDQAVNSIIVAAVLIGSVGLLFLWVLFRSSSHRLRGDRRGIWFSEHPKRQATKYFKCRRAERDPCEGGM